jgi:HK97 family phage portal protein
MGIIGNLIERRYGLADLDKSMDEVLSGIPTATGLAVSESTALHYSAVYACVSLLSETVASLPFILYRRLQPRGKERATDNPLYTVLHDRPNLEMIPASFYGALQGHIETWGNAFAEIDWDMATGQVRALWPLRPDKMKVGRFNGEIIYVYRLPDGTEAKLPGYRVLQIPGFGFDGMLGYSPVHLAREAIALGLATEEYGARFFGNGSNPGGVLEHPGTMKPGTAEQLRTQWNEMHQGLSNQHRIAILEGGMKWHQVGIPPEDAQFLQTRVYQLREVARWYRVPPHLIGDLERATFSNIEHMGIEFLQYTMRIRLTRWAQSVALKMLGPAEQKNYFAEHLVDALLQGDTQARFTAYATARQWGWMSANDIREKENQNPIEGGDEYLVPLNMVPASKIGQEPAQPEPDADSDNARRSVLEAVIRRIAERERQNILRAARKYDTDSFTAWLNDFYRDFPDYILQQVEPVLGDKTADCVRNYVRESRLELAGISPHTAESLLTNWVQERTRQSYLLEE